MSLTRPDEISAKGDDNLSSQHGQHSKLELSFEYLMNNNELQWITVISSQAILMSLCLQSMVEELLRLRSGTALKKAGEKSCIIEYSYPKRDGTTKKIPIKSGLHPKNGGCPRQAKVRRSDNLLQGLLIKFLIWQIDPKTLASMTSRTYSVKRLSERFDKLNFRDASMAAEDVLIENEAFVNVNDREPSPCNSEDRRAL